MSAESDFDSSSPEPTRALLLAHALDTCIQSERERPGSADPLIAQQPAWARAELRRLVALAGSLDAAATNAVMSEEFRVGARARLMQHITGSSAHAAPLTTLPSQNGHHPVTARGHARWLWRGGAGGLLAATLVLAATLTASASSLPGDPLYAVKQAREEIGVRFAPDDQSRALALLAQANARLDETARLLDAGRTEQASQTTQQFDAVLDRATTTYVVTITGSASDEPTTAHMQTQLGQEQQQLETLLQSAPEPARADLRQALVATERSRALVTDPKPVQAALGRTRRPANASVGVPTVAAEAIPTEAPTPVVLTAHTSPPPIDLVAQPTRESVEIEADEHPVVVRAVVPNAPAVGARTSSSSRGRGQSPPVVSVQSHEDDAAVEVLDRHDDAPPAALVVQPPHGDDDRDRVAEQPTAIPLARQAQSSDQSSTSSGVTSVSASRQQSHDGDATAAQPTAIVKSATAVTTAKTTTNTTSTTSSRSGGGDTSSGDGSHTTTTTSTPTTSTTSGDGGKTTTSTSSGDGGHSGSGSTDGHH